MPTPGAVGYVHTVRGWLWGYGGCIGLCLRQSQGLQATAVVHMVAGELVRPMENVEAQTYSTAEVGGRCI